MGIPSSVNPLFLGAAAQAEEGGYLIERSLRFNSADSAYLSRTPASAGNRTTWTWAGWVKRSALGARQGLFGGYDSSASPTNYTYIEFTSGDILQVESFSNAAQFLLSTTQVFRDCSAWYHVVVAYNSTQGTSSNRLKLYVNGSQVTAFGTASYPSSDYQSGINTANAHDIGRYPNISQYYLSGYLADIHFIDGQALDPTSFGEFDATTGVWVPKAYTGTYGTNGFHLEFADNSSNTATTLGKDTSPNGNNWTPNNLSVTAGAGNDSLVDVPTNGAQTDTGAGGEVRGNYATLNPLALGGSLANGNLDFTSSGSGGSTSTVGVSSGKWYWEVYIGSTPTNTYVGLYDNPNSLLDGYAVTGTGGNRFTTAGGTFTVTSGTFQVGDIFGVAADIDAGTVTWYRNGSVAVTLTGATLNTKPWFPGTNVNAAASSPIIYNFGQRPFAYTAPSGFKALNTANLPAPLVTKPSDVMDVALYTGNGSTQTISGLGFSPDLVWIKSRVDAFSHRLQDTVRGVKKELNSDLTTAEFTYTVEQGLTAFNSDGFTLIDGATANGAYNKNNSAFAAWAWDAGSSTVTNTQGSISSQVRANASAGFSVVTYTGNGTDGATVGHGLGVAPAFIILKGRTTVTNWGTWHKDVGKYDANHSYALAINLTRAADATAQFALFYPGLNSSTVFGLGNEISSNQNNDNYVAYCFAPVAGYSAFGSYTGNGSTDGPFVFTGFRPKFILLKNISDGYDGGGSIVNSHSWLIYDTARGTYNATGQILAPNKSFAEENNNTDIDILSNGFKLRTNRSAMNPGSTQTMIYAAFAEHPFQYSRAR